ncbi:transcription factor MYB77-like [Phragmites australis]|uniref:transcription factor MYB77-like n=1 Tax=Phragmites australis TaxID=29695 RepID=UPI002D786B99|nr:transcription factor MYB77-like [Phragmites australis]
MENSAAVASSAAARGRCIARLKLPRAWTAEEDARLERLAKENGFGHWHRVARRMPGRSSRSCRDRWRHHLARDVYHRPFTARDDEELRRLVERFGGSGRWKDIGRAAYGRTSRVMKRRWKEIRKANNSGGGAKIYYPPALPSDDDQDLESGETAALQQGPSYPYADDVLASSFASCSLAIAAVDPRAGSLALGFACMAL